MSESHFPASTCWTPRVWQAALILTLHLRPITYCMMVWQEVSETSCQEQLGITSEKPAASTKASRVLEESSWSLLRHKGRESATLTSPTGIPASPSCYRCGTCFDVCLLHTCMLCYSLFTDLNAACGTPAVRYALISMCGNWTTRLQFMLQVCMDEAILSISCVLSHQTRNFLSKGSSELSCC